MKKILPFLSLVIFLSLAMVSCGRKETSKKSLAFQTLEERYPAWTNLTWISTDKGRSDFPKMEISIRENVVTITQHMSDTDIVSKEFTVMYFLGNSLTFIDKNKGRLTAFYWQTDSTVMIKTKGLVDDYMVNAHSYMLKKN
jgi:hypothetical protein